MLRGTARPWATLLMLVAMLCTGLIAPTTAGAQTPLGMDQILPAGDDNVLYLSQLRTVFEPVAPGATISADAPVGISFVGALVTATDGSRPGEPARDLPTTVSADGRSIEWTVPGDIPSGSGLLFELTGAQSPGYSAWNFDGTFSLDLDIRAGGASRDVNSLGLGGAFFDSASQFFYGGAPVTWRLPSSSAALDQLVKGTGGEARFGSLSGAFIPAVEADEELPVSPSADGQKLTVTMPNRSETFTLVIDTGSEEPPLNDLHSLVFVAENVTVEEYFPCRPAEQVIGAIRDRYVSLDGPCGFLGDPLTAELATPVKFGRFNHFQGGSIYWSPATGAWEVHGAIRETWSRLGWENGAVGFPVTNELPTPTTFGAFNHFQSGSIYWSPATGAREVRGAIRDTWSRQGWENGALGFPTSDEYAIPGGRRSDFQGGFITWTPAGGTVVSTR